MRTFTASQKPCGGPAAEQRTTGRPSRAGSVDPERFDNCALPREMHRPGAAGDVCSGRTITAPVAAESRDPEATPRCEWRSDQTLTTTRRAGHHLHDVESVRSSESATDIYDVSYVDRPRN
jgi:hypothetical protein